MSIFDRFRLTGSRLFISGGSRGLALWIIPIRRRAKGKRKRDSFRFSLYHIVSKKTPSGRLPICGTGAANSLR
jgi:hypothetical protein